MDAAQGERVSATGDQNGKREVRSQAVARERSERVDADLEELWLSEVDLARYRPANPRQDRILPEFGR